LVPQSVPRQTKFDCKAAKIKALGHKNTIITDWLTKSNLSSVAGNPPKDGINQDPQDGIDPSNENIDPILLDSSVQAQAASEIEARLNNRFNQYLSSPKSKSKPTLATKAKGQFKELNNTIISVTSLYTKKAKKGSLFKIPTDVLANLHKFNLLWRDYALEGVKSPSNSAAISTAKSAIWRSPPSSKSVHRN
jgi:hypothetical protein